MAEIIRMPRLSDTMEEGNIVGWLKKVGDKVSPGDILAEVETDKATMELESFHEGYLLYVSVKEGPVPVNDILAVIGAKDEDYKSLLASVPKNEGQDAKPNGKKAEEPAPAKQESDPVTPAVSGNDVPSAPPAQSTPSSAPSISPSGDTRIKTSPLAKSIAAEAGIDISALTGTGDGGRIVKRDVESFVSNAKEQSAKPASAPAPQYGEFPISQMRKTIARRLAESKFSAPHFYLTIKINMDKAAEARKLINEQSGLKISINDFVIKGCAVALQTHPAVNSSWLGDRSVSTRISISALPLL